MINGAGCRLGEAPRAGWRAEPALRVLLPPPPHTPPTRTSCPQVFPLGGPPSLGKSLPSGLEVFLHKPTSEGPSSPDTGVDVGPASAGEGEAQAFVSQTVGSSWVVGGGTISLLVFRLGSASHPGPSHPFPDPDNRPHLTRVTSRSLDRRL